MARHAGTFQVGSGNADGLGRNIGAYDGHRDRTLGGVVVVNLIEEFGIEIGPCLESETLAEHAGSDIGGYQRGFAQECAATAHGIDKRTFAVPPAAQDDAGREHLVDGSLGLRHAVAALMKRLAAAVEAERHIGA